MSLLAGPKHPHHAEKRTGESFRWFHLPLAATIFLICFYLATLVTSIFIPLDVTLYGAADDEFAGRTLVRPTVPDRDY